MWESWSVWMIAALVLAFVEVLAPGFVFLGFAIGAALMALFYWLGAPFITLSLPMALLAFALVSLAAWVALRQVLGVRKGQVKVWDRDIND